MIFGTVLPTSAYNLDENNNSVESVEYQNTTDEDFTNKVNVFAQLGSEYKVTIPKTVVLSGASKDAKYYVKVAGDIAGYEKVSVIPEDSFKLSAKNKADETATINQDKTVWTVHDFDTDANGLIEAKNITAGKWKGTFNFNINLESDDVSVLPEEKVLGDLIVPDANDWNGQVLSDIYVMEVGDTGILEATNDGEDVSDALKITSSNEDVVKVENKQLKAVGTGQTTITTVYEDKSFSVKIKVVKPETPAHTHTAGEAVRENEVAATYEKEGSYDEVTYCADCGEELSRITKTIDKLEMVGGLYDENDNLIKSWDELVELGLDIEKDYNYAPYNTVPANASVFKNNNLSGKLIVSDSLTNIGKCAFEDCTSLESIVIPDSITSISDGTFAGCKSLTSIVIPDSVTNIGQSAFQNCTSLKSIAIPDSVTSIGDNAFWSCTNLTSITIPDSVTSIEVNAFYYCTSLESITYRGVTYTDKTTFNNKLKSDGVATKDVWY